MCFRLPEQWRTVGLFNQPVHENEIETMTKKTEVKRRQKRAIMRIGDNLHNTLMMASEFYAEGNVILAYMIVKSVWRPVVFVFKRRGEDGSAKGANLFDSTNGIRSLSAGNGLTPDQITKLRRADTTVAVGYDSPEDVADVIECGLFLLHFGNGKVARKRRQAARSTSHLARRRWWQLRRRLVS